MVDQGIGTAARLNDERERDVAEEGEQDDDEGAQQPTGTAEDRGQRECPSAHDEVEYEDHSGLGVDEGGDRSIRSVFGVVMWCVYSPRVDTHHWTGTGPRTKAFWERGRVDPFNSLGITDL